MATTVRLKDIAPYGVVLAAAGALYGVADRIAYTEIPNQIGPEVWPKIVLVLLIGVCLFEIVRRLVDGLRGRAEVVGAGEAPSTGTEGDHPRLVLGAVFATVAYLFVLEYLGFAISTFLYAACLMALGGTRRPGLVLAVSTAITLFFCFVFMKVIFVALPVGQEPFSKVSFFLMSMLGIR